MTDLYLDTIVDFERGEDEARERVERFLAKQGRPFETVKRKDGTSTVYTLMTKPGVRGQEPFKL